MPKSKKNGAFPTPKKCANHYLLCLLPQTPLREKVNRDNKCVTFLLLQGKK